MLDLFKPIISVGLETTSSSIKKAVVSSQQGKLTLSALSETPLDEWNSSVVGTGNPFVATGLEGSDVLTRQLNLPLKKEKDIDSALTFQAEPLLPYPVDQAVLTWSKAGESAEGSDIILFSARKDRMEKHLEHWKNLNIEPEIISSEPLALCQFASFYSSFDQPYFLIHLKDKSTTCVLIQQNQLLGSHTTGEGLELLNENPSEQGLQKLDRAISKMVYALTKEARGVPIEYCLITGEGAADQSLVDHICQKLEMKPLEPTLEGWPGKDLRHFALPIGLAIGGLADHPTNFRQQDFAYPHPWKRLIVPILTYFALCIGLSLAFYFFGQMYLHRDENHLKQQYVELLTQMNKSYESFEKSFYAKTPSAKEKYDGEIVDISRLDRQDIIDRIAFLQKELLSAPDSFPLYPNTPRVSDLLAWLSTHPKAVGTNDEPRIQIESLNYTMVKRPTQAKKTDKYQVKVELEFSSPTPTLAREFHDALIAPNDFVDTKGEVKWGANRGRYRTSFYLKDKTQYPGS